MKNLYAFEKINIYEKASENIGKFIKLKILRV